MTWRGSGLLEIASLPLAGAFSHGTQLPSVTCLVEPAPLPAAASEGIIHTGPAGSGCSVVPTDRKGPLDPMLALLAIAASIGARWRRKLRITRD